MTLEEFREKYLDKRPDYDNVNGAQCVDLIKLYCAEVLNVPIFAGDPKDLWKINTTQDFNYFFNTLFYVPPRGAIAIWNEKVGDGHGHVAIILEASLMSLLTLDLNWPLGAAVKEVKHNYSNVHGFLVQKHRASIQNYNELIDELRSLATKYSKI